MKKIFTLLSDGFSLPEMLINMVIVSAVTVSMFLVWFEVDRQTKLEYNKEEIREYSNLYLDLIAKEMRRSQTLNYSTVLSRTKIQTNNSEIIVDLDNGITKNDSIYYNYNPIDSEDGSKKFILRKFIIDDVSPSLGDNLIGEAQDARKASRKLILEVLLYTKKVQSIPYDTLKFERTVFCPGLLISEKNDGPL